MHELIGLNASVVRSACRNNEGMKGCVIDETKGTIVLELPDGEEKRIPKKSSVFVFSVPSGLKLEVDGNEIAFRPEDRPKKAR